MFEKKSLGFISKVELKQTHGKVVYWCMCVALIAISICMILPPIWIFVSGFKDTEEFFRIPPTIIPQSFHIEKIVNVWKELKFVLYYQNTLILAIGTVVFTIILNGFAGYVLSVLKPKGHRIAFGVITLLMMVPSTVGMVPLYMTICDFPYLHFSMLGTFLPMWLMAGMNCFNILLFKNFFESIPSSYAEAARIDGATNMRIFFQIILPLSIPIIVTVSILTFNTSWGDFFWPYLVLRDKSLYTISIYLFQNKGEFTVDVYMLILTLAILPPAVIYAFLQKRIIGGLTTGGVKG